MNRRFSAVPLGLALSFLLLGSSRADDWPRFRGPNGSGVSDSKNIPSEFGPDKNVIWKIESSSGASSPILAGGKLFYSSSDGDHRNVHCLDAKTGKLIWEQSISKVRDEVSSYGAAICTPSTDGKYVVAFFPDAGLVCYSIGGNVQWKIPVGPFYSMHGMSNSPIIVGEKVVLLADQLKGSFLAVHDLATGNQIWKADRMNGLTGGYSSPTVLEVVGKEPMVIASGPEGLSAYELTTGKVVFSVLGVTNAPVTVPLISGNQLFVCEPAGVTEPIDSMLPMFDANGDGNISLVEAEKSAAMSRMLEGMDKKWGNDDGVVEPGEWDAAFGSFVDKGGLVAVRLDSSGDTIEADVEWTHSKAVPYVASPLIYEGVLYFVQDGGILTAMDAKSGDVLKRARLKKGGGKFYASPVAADGKIFLVDTAGLVTVVRAGADWEVLNSVSLEDSCSASPAIGNSRIYFRTKTSLYCFGQE